MFRKIAAGIILALLLIIPFINWRMGAVFWLCAMIIFVMQGLFNRKNWNLGVPEDDNQEDSEEEE